MARKFGPIASALADRVLSNPAVMEHAQLTLENGQAARGLLPLADMSVRHKSATLVGGTALQRGDQIDIVLGESGSLRRNNATIELMGELSQEERDPTTGQPRVVTRQVAKVVLGDGREIQGAIETVHETALPKPGGLARVIRRVLGTPVDDKPLQTISRNLDFGARLAILPIVKLADGRPVADVSQRQITDARVIGITCIGRPSELVDGYVHKFPVGLTPDTCGIPDALLIGTVQSSGQQRPQRNNASPTSGQNLPVIF